MNFDDMDESSPHDPMNPTYDPGEDEKEASLRPRYMSEFQGQERIKENLLIFIKAARERGEALDHLFLMGPPGLGKTTLALVVASEMGADFKPTSAPAIEKPKDLAGILTNLRPGGVLFIDEIHRLKPAIEEMLYIAMEDFELDWIIGQGPAARTVRIPLQPFTLVGATTKAGMVSAPLSSRFGISLRFDYYAPEELASVIHRSSHILDIKIEDDAVELLAGTSRGTPRIANRLLRRMRDFAQVKGAGTITKDVVHDGLGRLEVDYLGLERLDREILKAIIMRFGGGPVGAETLAVSVSESVESLEDFYEPYLIQIGMLARTPRGRVATPAAYRHLGMEQPNENGRLQF
ncbi:ATP-dependent DNA helicase, component of RuvABC resolvasome [uncultured spirochete]|jgi:Holliday junction DNA helicase RuvB|uniref:Holliday junction branch migration complex subunit RuvB n=1 Tax=uncultured spirochete TaxID=156406 RepID=A0A3P3XUI7_9SPIR|nr:ATP-dependent DNA helicase, component of RuvABC resolvasome [uncultured spirochete]SLM19583.1 ATP-dependent DNA helicase, component of RuvABC resolvasome [uncultured spirochete]